MAKVNFPSSPTDGDFFFTNGVYYVYDATKDIWKVLESGSVFSAVDAQTLEGEAGSYYLNYNNLNNRPALNFDTGNVTETVNLYFSNARVDARFNTAFTTKSTSDLSEGSNLYFSNARARLAIVEGSGISYDNSTGVINAGITSVAGKTGDVVLSTTDIVGLNTANVAEETNLYYTEARFDTRFDITFSSKSTTDLAEGNNLYFSNARVIAGLVDSGNVIPSGTKMLFVQSTAPTGWTKDTTHNDKALRVVSGSVGTGGTTGFSTVFAGRTPTGTVGDTTLTAAQSGVPAHNHGITDPGHSHTQTTSTTDGANVRADSSSGGTVYNNIGNINANTTGISVNNSTPANAAEAHNHSFTGTEMDFAVQYVDVIIATKD